MAGCVDYRRLNAITITDTYPLPRIDDLLHAAKTTPFMSTIDLKSGYWQIKIAEADKLKTAFTTPFGIFIFNRMPFGLKNAPATFQRLIDKFRAGLPNILILAYLDDIIICSKDFQSHLIEIKATFERLAEFGFRLNRDKCHFCLPEIKYLGHILTVDGVKIDPEKTEAIITRPRPKNAKQLNSFLQTCSWYKKFMPNFASISKPLSDLLKKNKKWKWSEEEQQSFDKLKLLLVSPPILQQVKEDEGFFLKTDASNYAIGAVLLQGEKDKEHPIEYASRLLNPAERNYSTTEREALAVVWAIDKYRGYIEGALVTVLTDHQPLKWLFSLKSPTGRLARWALRLQPYNLKFGYTPGRQNTVADTLSRPPCADINHVEICECFAIHIDLPHEGSADFRAAQLEDENLKEIIQAFESSNENVYRYTNRGFIMYDGVLYHYGTDEDAENGQLVVPQSLKNIIMFKHHDDPLAGHYGVERTINRIYPLYYWQNMRSDITKDVKQCIECNRYKPSNMKPAGLMQTVASNQRFEVIAIDLVGPLPRSSDGHQWILVIEDLCSRWVELFPLREATAQNCALTLLNEVLLRFGIPRRIHSDNGCQFIPSLMQKLTFCLGIKQTFTPVYHPEANPVERKNRDLKYQLSILVDKDHTNWNLNLPSIRFAMNTAKCSSTGYTSAFLTLGREQWTPTEVNFDLKAVIQSETFIPQITPHLMRLADIIKLVEETQQRMQDKNQQYANQKRQPQKIINIGDKVMVDTHILSKASQGLTSKFVPKRDGPYIIIAKEGAVCFKVASKENPNISLGTHHVSTLTPYKGPADTPVYPMRRRGRPAISKQNPNTNTTTTPQNNPTTHTSTTNIPNLQTSLAEDHKRQEENSAYRRSARLKAKAQQ